jgi:murein DD-endopeptidase MepM/ murein hydrolase activator NlpD
LDGSPGYFIPPTESFISETVKSITNPDTLLEVPSTSPIPPEVGLTLINNEDQIGVSEPENSVITTTITSSSNGEGITATPVRLVFAPTPQPIPKEHNPKHLLPDSELVYSPSAIDFDVSAYLLDEGGFLSTYRQWLKISGWNTGAEIVAQTALENSINPRLFLALLEFQSGGILSMLDENIDFEYAMGAIDYYREDLYGQLVWAAHQLSVGFYGWLDSSIKSITFTDGSSLHPHPDLNAGTFAIQYFFAQLYDGEQWAQVLIPESGFFSLYESMFGDPWTRDLFTQELLPPGLHQPELLFPFMPGTVWAYTGGPHPAFENNGPRASLDFAPSSDVSGCFKSKSWVTAMADGRIVRSEHGVVVQDLDNDGYEQTGWVLMYLHIEDQDRVADGSYLNAGDPIGHPSCDGGRATGTHVHIARKYNGVWISADEKIPFVIDGWTAYPGDEVYLGTLVSGDKIINAHQYGSRTSYISWEIPVEGQGE